MSGTSTNGSDAFYWLDAARVFALPAVERVHRPADHGTPDPLIRLAVDSEEWHPAGRAAAPVRGSDPGGGYVRC
jgi:hypothetical protein